MHTEAKHIIQQLFTGHYILRTGMHTSGPKKGKFIYKLYVGRRNPVAYVKEQHFD
jgi:hypothetical protein